MLTTPRGLMPHIGLFGCRIAGKSSWFNALTGQERAIVSARPGSTTDPVEKAYELLPFGPVLFVDTAGIDDVGDLGEMRIEKTLKALDHTDLGIIVTDGPIGDDEVKLMDALAERETPYCIVFTKADLGAPPAEALAAIRSRDVPFAIISTASKADAVRVREVILQAAPESSFEVPHLLADLVPAGGHVVLVVPIDLSAPKGRLILPQVMAIRDILDADASCTVVKERELASTLKMLGKKPDLVVCDSQIVLKAAADTPDDVPLTTFSILMARFKGDLVRLAEGAARIDQLKPGDRVLIAEACTHHSMADDIGRVKIPRWFRQYAGGDIEFETMAGRAFPEDLSPYALVVQCGACTVNRKQVLLRIRQAERQGVPITNYGVAISRVQGVLHRSLGPFPSARIAFERASAAQ